MSKKCPYCAETIQDEAKKCRYCGEWLETDTQEIPKKKSPTPTDNSQKHSAAGAIVLVLFLFFAFAAMGLAYSRANLMADPPKVFPTITPTKPPSECPSGKISCQVGSEKQCLTQTECQQKTGKVKGTSTTQKTTSTATSSDPPVHCRIHADCGGGTIPLKKSECENTICCYNDGKWEFLRDKSQCKTETTTTASTTTTENINNLKIKCSFDGGNGIKYDYGEIPFNECMDKKEAFWDKQFQNLYETPIQPNYIYIPPISTRTQEEIDRCKNDASSNAAAQDIGCDQRFGSASELSRICKQVNLTNLNKALAECD